jgi:primosomal protein N' (replication factor Y)
VPPALAGRVTVGVLVRMPFGGRRVRGVVVAILRRAPPRPLEALAGVVVDAPVAPPPLEHLFEWVARRYCSPRGAAFARAAPARVRVQVGDPTTLGEGPAPERVLRYEGGRDLVDALASGRPQAWCVRVLPGEDRGALIAEVVGAASRSRAGACLVAVPEVRYGSAVLDALVTRWPDGARVDSSRDAGERAEGWLRLARGHGLGLGGRAAVLAPAPRVTLIVVDDEAHPSYKETRSPRFDARRVALHRAGLQGATCVLLDTAPSLEAAHAAARGHLRLVEPARAAARRARPVVEVVPKPPDGAVSRLLHRRVSRALREGQRVALLAGARGFARTVWCAWCRRSLRCRRCETGMALDRGDGEPVVRCPRCGQSAAAPSSCPTCGRQRWRFLGAGTERLAHQAARAWPRAVVARVDRDVVDEAARAAVPDIYVTTWIGTKPALRPQVSLVGVLDADALIRRPHWRAAESAYRALAAMAEWAGPAGGGGRLVVQCSEPAHHAVQAVVRADFRYWVDRELRARAELGYPPFSELVALRAEGERRAEVVARAADACRSAGADVVGPVTAPGRTGDRASLELLAKCPDGGAVADALRDILASVPPGNALHVDVDAR